MGENTLNRYLLVRYTDGIQNEKHFGEWYAVICDTFLDLNELPAKNRSEIRRGLKNCVVKMVDLDFIAEQGYHVYASALKNYTGAKIKAITENQFKRNILLEKDFHDIRHYWGVLHNDKLIAYSANYIYDTIEVDYTAIKFHPEFLKLYPSYALLYTMNQYYLKENSFEYVNDGFRNILHETNIQEYLIDKFNFKKEYTNLNIFYKPSLSILLSTSFPFRKFISKIHPKLGALYKLEEIKRSHGQDEKL